MIKKILRFLIFVAAGAAVGFAYYHLFGCATASCPITASLPRTMTYTAIIGALFWAALCTVDKDPAKQPQQPEETEQ